MRATISLLGLYNYDPTVLDGLTLPENFSSGDIDILKNNLLMETAEFELLYSDPNFLKFAVTNWCNKNRPTWKWLYDTQHYEYNPIWNVDYHQSDRTDTTDKNVGTSTNTNNFTRGLYENEDTTDKMTFGSQMAHNFDSELEHAYNSQLEHIFDSELEHAFNSELEKAFNSTLEHGYDSELEHAFNSEIERAFNSNLEHNFDSELEKSYNSTLAKTYSGTAQEAHSGDTDTETKNHTIEKSGSETTEHSVSAYNQSNAYHPESKDVHSFNNFKDTENGNVIFTDNITIDNTTDYTDTDVHTGTDTDTHSGKDTDKHTGADTDTHSGADTDTHSGKDTDKHTGADTDTHSGADTDTHSGKDTDKHTGADTDTHSGADTDVHSGADTRTVDRDLSQTGGTTTTDNGRSTSDTDTNVKYEKYLRGNYGQSTTQSMILQEQELAKKNIFDYIICDFKKRFCLMVY